MSDCQVPLYETKVLERVARGLEWTIWGEYQVDLTDVTVAFGFEPVQPRTEPRMVVRSMQIFILWNMSLPS